ncbi:ABC transporter substrate-binding protein [Subtercola boreus]|uniref:ABC transporter substrate-binding protein n=1 Tax=Subtercola boreus TaxID=120213 RepID=A0A3E0W8T4_9MICO|nr:ABC transporter substrate-binding protein [Subtercola boreus]RFA18697.1 ABC transporter substrate-binding protein [Subtercola boreus]RFA18719.1 ABC transporter substrate-binding protein [Subtercola boreus]RFA25330.1 ABC transporter substrate-binding protein [Subtercola boreus]
MGVAALAVAALALTACSSSTAASSSSSSVDAKTATDAAAFGGMDALVAAAKTEGALNVIALPDDWANYGKIIEAFKAKYGITVNSASPDASSAEEITAATSLVGQDTAPDVFDLGPAVTLANTDKFAPYKVSSWSDIPDANKESTGLWVNDYTGLMSVGYNSNVVKTAPTKLDDLLGSDYKGKVAINGDPTQAGAAFAAVGLAAVQSGGSLDDFQPGIDFFQKLNKAGNFLTVDPTPATIASGETAVVFDWSYNNLASAAATPGWKTTILPGTAYGSYYNQAVSADAPHPAAARLWQEFIYSADAQNLYLAAGAFPVLLTAMDAAGTTDKTAQAAVGTMPDNFVSPTAEQSSAAAALLSANWATAIQ